MEVAARDDSVELGAERGMATLLAGCSASLSTTWLMEAKLLSDDSSGPLFQGPQLREVKGCLSTGSAREGPGCLAVDRGLAQLRQSEEQAMLFPFITPRQDE